MERILTIFASTFIPALIAFLTALGVFIKKLLKDIAEFKKALHPRLKKIDDTHHILKDNGIQIICKHEQTCYNQKHERKK